MAIDSVLLNLFSFGNKLYCNESFLLDTAILLVLLMTICSFSLSAYNLSKSLFNLSKDLNQIQTMNLIYLLNFL